MITVTLLKQSGDPIGEVGTDLVGLNFQQRNATLTIKGQSPLIGWLMKCRQSPLMVRVDGAGWVAEYDVVGHSYTLESDGQWLSDSLLAYRSLPDHEADQ